VSAVPATPSYLALARRSFWLFFGAIWLCVGLALLAGGVVFAATEAQYADAVATTGLVLGKDIVPADSDSSTEYRVRYRFTTDNGETVEGDEAVSVEAWEALVERGPIVVYYLPARPGASRLSAGADPTGPLIFGLMGIIFGGIGGILVVHSLRDIRRARRLLTLGTPVRATVLGVEQTNVSINRRNQFRVRYTYRDALGREYEGTSGYLDWTEAETWDPGDECLVHFDPARPEESYWIGRVEVGPEPAIAPG
jgi:hypothetical protein